MIAAFAMASPIGLVLCANEGIASLTASPFCCGFPGLAFRKTIFKVTRIVAFAILDKAAPNFVRRIRFLAHLLSSFSGIGLAVERAARISFAIQLLASIIAIS